MQCRNCVSVRPTCGGRRICFSPWIVIAVIALFILVLFVRCHHAKTCAVQESAAVLSTADVSHETME